MSDPRKQYPKSLWIPVHPAAYNGAPVCGDYEITERLDDNTDLELPCSNGGRWVRYVRSDLKHDPGDGCCDK